MTSLQHRGISFLTCLVLNSKLRKSIHWTKELLELSWSKGGRLFTFLLLLSWFLSLSWLPIKWHIRILKHAGNMVIYITMREIYQRRFDYVLADSASYFATTSTPIIPAKGSLLMIPTSDPYLKWRYYPVKEACSMYIYSKTLLVGSHHSILPFQKANPGGFYGVWFQWDTQSYS